MQIIEELSGHLRCLRVCCYESNYEQRHHAASNHPTANLPQRTTGHPFRGMTVSVRLDGMTAISTFALSVGYINTYDIEGGLRGADGRLGR